MERKFTFTAIIIVLLIFMFRDFLGVILLTFVLAFIFLPVFKWLSKRMNRQLSAIICVLALLILVFLPFFIIINSLYEEISQIPFEDITGFVSSIPLPDGFSISQEDARNFIVNGLVSGARAGLEYIPLLFINLVIVFFGFYYLLIDWDNFSRRFKENFPLNERDKFFTNLSKKTKGLIYGLFLVGLYDFLIAAIGFSISGVNLALIFALLIGLAAVSNVIDPFVIWVPLAIYYFATGDSGTAIGVLITGGIITLDVFVRPKVIGRFADINPFVILLGIVGGVSLFGFVGLVVGPILLIAALEILDYLY